MEYQDQGSESNLSSDVIVSSNGRKYKTYRSKKEYKAQTNNCLFVANC